MKKVARLSRFSQNISLDLLKNLQLSFFDQMTENLKNSSSELTDSLSVTKRSILIEEKKTSKDIKQVEDNIKQTNQYDLFSSENNGKKGKCYDVDEIKKYKQALKQIPNLTQKPKKLKSKIATPELVQFVFQVLKNFDFIQKMFSSYVPQESIINEFINAFNGFQLKQYPAGRSICINKDDALLHIFMEGAAEKVTIREQNRDQRKSMSQYVSSETSIVRRSKMKNKTLTEKKRIYCSQSHMPILINQKDCNVCNFKTMSDCKFILLQKCIWNKLLITLQKLQEKHLVTFIKHCTTINLNICIEKENSQNYQEKKKTFLYDLKYPNQSLSDDEYENESSGKVISGKRTTVHIGSLSSSYKFLPIIKDQKLTLDNQDVYLLVKGSVMLITNAYSMIINEGSIVNSFVLLDLEKKYVKIKALTETLLVKLVLSQLYFRKEDQKDFVNKIEDIETFRRQISNKYDQLNFNNENKSNSRIFNLKKQPNHDSQILTNEDSPLTKLKSKFQPKQLRLKQLSFEKGQNRIQSKKERISHKKKRIVTEPDSRQFQVARKVAIKYANNFCIFEKIVQSEEKVVEKYNLNRVNKLFPIQALLQNLTFQKNLEVSGKMKKKNKHSNLNLSKNQQSQVKQSIIPQEKDQIKQVQTDQSNSINENKQQSNPNIKRNSEQQFKALKKRRREYEKELMQRKKKEKAKVIDNLFEINKFDRKTNESQDYLRKNKRNDSLQFQKIKIRNIIHRNSMMKLKQMKTQQSFIDLKGNDNSLEQFQKVNKKVSSHNDSRILSELSHNIQNQKMQQNNWGQKSHFRVTNHKCMTQFSRINKSTECLNQKQMSQNQHIENEFRRLRKKTTKRIKTTMLTGRIRQSKAG